MPVRVTVLPAVSVTIPAFAPPVEIPIFSPVAPLKLAFPPTTNPPAKMDPVDVLEDTESVTLNNARKIALAPPLSPIISKQ